MNESHKVSSGIFGVEISDGESTITVKYADVMPLVRNILTSASRRSGFMCCDKVATQELRKMASILGIEPRV